MNKVIELAIEADSATGFPIACIEAQKIKPFLERFYALARADLEAENAKLRKALSPFVLANSSEEHMTLIVRTADITAARAVLGEKHGSDRT